MNMFCHRNKGTEIDSNQDAIVTRANQGVEDCL